MCGDRHLVYRPSVILLGTQKCDRRCWSTLVLFRYSWTNCWAPCLLCLYWFGGFIADELRDARHCLLHRIGTVSVTFFFPLAINSVQPRGGGGGDGGSVSVGIRWIWIGSVCISSKNHRLHVRCLKSLTLFRRIQAMALWNGWAEYAEARDITMKKGPYHPPYTQFMHTCSV